MSFLPSVITGSRVYPIGIDLSSHGVRLLQLRRTRRGMGVVASTHIELAESDAGLDTAAAALKSVADAIAARVSTGGFSGRRCVIAPSDRWLRVRSVRQPPMTADELDRAARVEAPSRLGFAENEPCELAALRAGEVVQGTDSRDEVIYLGAKRESLERLVYALAASGLRPMHVEPSFMATARVHSRSLRRAADQQTARLIVEIGWSLTNVTLIRGLTIAFHKMIEIGGRSMSVRAAERLGLDPSTIAELRRRRMMPGPNPDADPRVDRALFDAIRPVIGDLAHEIALCQRYYSVTFRGSRPDLCVLTGSEADEPHLAEAIGESLRLRTVNADPLEGIAPASSATDPSRSASRGQWAVATGLALRLAERLTVAKESKSAIRLGDRDEAPSKSREAA